MNSLSSTDISTIYNTFMSDMDSVEKDIVVTTFVTNDISIKGVFI